MVDFKKHISGKKTEAPIDPVKLYDTLDRAHDKGPLRPAQLSVLQNWFVNHSTSSESIIKLHTGQGKTLIGLLLLQAQLNAGKGPSLYLCPDNFLIKQTCDQAKQFGIKTCLAESELPLEFLHSKEILVTSIQKLFNGLTKFGLNGGFTQITTLLMDDAHACADKIRDAFRIRIPSNEPVYNALLTLFADDLEQQGQGTYADICNGDRNSFLPIPYWAWIDKSSDVTRILSKDKDKKFLKFTWPLIKDILDKCQCVISGNLIEIEPYLLPLDIFGSYTMASYRIFMSATLSDDAFLIKGLQLKPETILNPITYSMESWSGEKMVLLPSVIHETLTHDFIISKLAVDRPNRNYGVVALVPSFARTKNWESYGAIIANKESKSEGGKGGEIENSVEKIISDLYTGKYDKTYVLVNRYDGIDLPDNVCRILIIDGLPFAENLVDKYSEDCRPKSIVTIMRTLRTIEQGMGRSVRGEKDYSVIIIVGTDITRLIQNKDSQKYISSQLSTQINISLDISEMAEKEIEDGNKPIEVLKQLINQCLKRDPSWKEYYAEQMAKVKSPILNKEIFSIYSKELKAEQAYSRGDYGNAVILIQDLLDTETILSNDRGWYLQEIARYNYSSNRIESQTKQIAAHNINRYLLKPSSGITVTKLTILSQERIQSIANWINQFETYTELEIVLSDSLGRLVFGTKADKFEQALHEIGLVIGFAGERPDKEWKEGPDNLWALEDRQYILWECKSEVEITRSEINKREAEQMNRSSAWFSKHYPGINVKRIIVHPTHIESSAASFTDDVSVMRAQELKKLVDNIRVFFKSFEGLNFKNLSLPHIQALLNTHQLSVKDILDDYTKKLKRH